MSNPYIVQLPVKTTPVGADVFILADSQDSNNEVQSTITEVITNNNIVTQTGSIESGDIPVSNGSGAIKDSGIAVDTSRNVTNMNSLTLGADPVSALQAATKQYADLKLAKASNLSDVANRQTSFKNVAPIDPNTGDLIYYDGTNWVDIAIGSESQVLTSIAGLPAWEPIPSPGGLVRVIATTTTLTAADFGKTIVCTGGSAYNVTLPLASVGNYDFINFVIDTTSNAIVTILGQGGNTISGQASIPMGNFDGMNVMTDANNYLITNSSIYPVSLQAYTSTQQSITSSGTITLAVDTANYDIGGSLNSGTHVMTPRWPGKYTFYHQIELVAPATTTLFQPKINFNGSTASTCYISLNGLVSFGGYSLTSLLYTTICNGSTDYFTVTEAQQSTGAGSQLVNNNPLFTYVEMKRISFF